MGTDGEVLIVHAYVGESPEDESMFMCHIILNNEQLSDDITSVVPAVGIGLVMMSQN